MRQGRFILIKTTSIKVSNYLKHVPVTQFNQPQGGNSLSFSEGAFWGLQFGEA